MQNGRLKEKLVVKGTNYIIKISDLMLNQAITLMMHIMIFFMFLVLAVFPVFPKLLPHSFPTSLPNLFALTFRNIIHFTTS